MAVLNDMDRFRLVADAVDRLLQRGVHGVCLKREMPDKLIEHKQYIRAYSQDMPGIRNWRWSRPQATA